MSQDEQQEFNQQEFNKEMRKNLDDYGFEYRGDNCYLHPLDKENKFKNCIYIELFERSPMCVWINTNSKSRLESYRFNHSMDWIKEQAKFYLGIDLVKKEEKEPLKCTLENAWKGEDMAYWINNGGALDFNYLEIDETNPVRDGNEVRRKSDGEKLLLIPSLMNLINYANRMFPQVEEDEGKLWYPLVSKKGVLFCSPKRTIFNPFAFASEKAFEFFKEQPENVELLKRVLTPTL